jgi:MEDS: MEthanogen/methylotroph, DcmR Sensory domain
MDGVRHQCMIYEGSPAIHWQGVASVIREKLKENWRCLYLNSPTMVAGMRSYLAAAGLNVSAEVSNGALVLSSDDGHLIAGRFDVDRMIGMLSDAIDDASGDGYAGLWAAGDMTWEFGSEKNFTKLMEYEYRLEGLFQKHPELQGICQYHADTLPVDTLETALYTHRAYYINATLSQMNPYYTEPGFTKRAKIPTGQWKQMLASGHDRPSQNDR